jgi:hypothetical protein
VLAGVRAPLRPRAHLRPVQAGPRGAAPKIGDPAAADRWTWLIITAHAQLWLARPLAADLRLPGERPALPGPLTPARVRRGFGNIRAAMPCLTGAPKPGKPGPGRPPGSKNRRPAPRYDAGKPPEGNAPSRHGANGQVREQAKAGRQRTSIPPPADYELTTRTPARPRTACFIRH